ncbi:trypsin-like peptidase domain-containing protein [Streptomyces fuscigenes]|uniref:trypsin-like peptidase domain-containing protein n=1 Tax=Streptomyces fuscigenes TaxID=1528880 RepID=UPI001F23AA2F|nr:trypsin-like peptidase domain-containing protein [Streptomyces fuscigenes]MCF3962589.1 serine protease [Streptomyces fuscigenes]
MNGTHFLDRFPFDWTDPAARELLGFLAETYHQKAPVLRLAAQAGVRLGEINWDQPMGQAWFDLLTQARREDRLRALLEQIITGTDTAAATRVAELTADAPVTEAPAPAELPGQWAGYSDPSAEERQIFDRYTLLDVSFLARGVEVAASVVRLLVTFPHAQCHGTAFRIGDDLLLTSHHVLHDKRRGSIRAEHVEAWFGFERDLSGNHLEHQVVPCNPESVEGDPQRDWAVIRCAAPIPAGVPSIDLDDTATVEPGDRVYIIQHPHGGLKKLAAHHNIVRHADDDVVQYWTDTERGSSGAPVFDQEWRLVALHRRSVPGPRSPQGDEEFRNEGIRIHHVAAGVRSAGLG